MPSLFPGMDPYLEGPLWLSFQMPFCVEISRQLTQKLRPRFVAWTWKRQVIDEFQVGRAGSASLGRNESQKALTLPRRRGKRLARRNQTFVEIRTIPERKLVTNVEVLTEINKQGPGRDEYRRRRKRILRNDVHLVEIDLLRASDQIPPHDVRDQQAYCVVVQRAGKDRAPIRASFGLHDRLPQVNVPIANNEDTSLDLQVAFDETYDRGSFDLAIDYHNPRGVPLTAEQTAWAAERLR